MTGQTPVPTCTVAPLSAGRRSVVPVTGGGPAGSAGPRRTSANSRLRQGPGNGSAGGPRPRLPGQGLQMLSRTASPQDVAAARAREARSGQGLLTEAGEPPTRISTCSPARRKVTRRQKLWGWGVQFQVCPSDSLR